MDVLVLAETTNQKNLFETASRFVGKNLGKLEKSSAYQEMVNENPKMFTRVFSKMLEVKQEPRINLRRPGINLRRPVDSSSDDD